MQYFINTETGSDKAVGWMTGMIQSRVGFFFHISWLWGSLQPHPMGTGVLSSGAEQLQHEANHSPSSSAKVTNLWIYT
jgi:hypothetical protein